MSDFSVGSPLDESDRLRMEIQQGRLERDLIDRTPAEDDWQVDDESEIFSFEEALLAIPRGVEGFGRSVVGLVPGIDLENERFFGRSETLVGAGLESIVQFGLGFLPGLGVAGIIGRTATATRVSAALSASKAGRFALGATKGSVAGGVADFLAFDGHEKNFSSLIETIPALRNPLTEFLATDEEDPEVIGRIKNVLEGFGMGATLGVVVESVRGLRAVRKARTLEASPADLKVAQEAAVDPERVTASMEETLALPAGNAPEPAPLAREAVEGAEEGAPEIFYRADSSEGLHPTEAREGLLPLSRSKRIADLYLPKGDYGTVAKGGRTRAYEVDIKNPLRVLGEHDGAKVIAGLDAQGDKLAASIIEGAKDNGSFYFWRSTKELFQETWANILIPQLKKLGYDGLEYWDAHGDGAENITLAAFGRKQLKERAVVRSAPTPRAAEGVPADQPGSGVFVAEGTTREARFLHENVTLDRNDPRYESGVDQPVGPGGTVRTIGQRSLAELVPEGRTLFHDTNLGSARALISRLEAGMRGHNLFASDSADLALGQKGSGYVLELDPRLVNGSRPSSLQNKLLKATQGERAVSEVKIDKSLPGSLLSITAPTRKGVEALKKVKGIEKRFDFDNIEEVERGFRIKRKANARGVDPESLVEPRSSGAVPEAPRAAEGAGFVGPPKPPKQIVNQLAGEDVEEIPLEVLAFERSESTRPNPKAHPRPKTEEGRAEALENGLDKNNVNLTGWGVTEGAANVVRGVEDLNRIGLEGTKPIPNDATILRANEQAAALNGEGLEEYLAKEAAYSREQAALTVESLPRALAQKQILARLAEDLSELFRAYRAGDSQALEKIESLLALQEDLLVARSNLATARGQALQSEGIAVLASPQELITGALAAASKDGPEKLLRVMDELDSMAARGATVEEKARFLAYQKMTLGRQVSRTIFELYINSILSAAKTITVQPATAGMLSLYKPIENMVGGALTGNFRAARREMHKVFALGDSVREAALAAWHTAKTNTSRFAPKVSFRDDKISGGNFIRAGVFGTRPGSLSGTIADYTGNAIGSPTRLIRTVDEFSKVMEGRSGLKADLIMQGLDEGLDVPAAKALAEKRLDKIFVDGQLQTEKVAKKRAIARAKELGITDPTAQRTYVKENWEEFFDTSASQVTQRNFDSALEVTMQTPPGKIGRAIQLAIDTIPLGRYVMPFYKTSANLAKAVGQRLDVPSMARHMVANKFGVGLEGLENSRMRYIQDMMSGDPDRKAEAVGRVVTGLGILSFGGTLAASGMITGRGPKGRDEREAMMDAGWLPYSIRTENGYVQYLRMDPFASFFGLMADGFDSMRMNGDDDEDIARNLTDAMLVSIANNFTSRSFLQGLGDIISAMEDPEKNMSWVVERYAGAVVPNGLSQVVALTGDESLKETHGIFERLESRTPGFSEGATPRRNMLGEVIDRSKSYGEDSLGAFYGMFVPIAYREVSSDVIRRELFDLQHGFQPPRAKLAGIDLRDIQNSKGQSAHDRWAELHGKVTINGRTLRQDLSGLVRSAAYRRLSLSGDSSGPSPRVRLIQTVLRRYRDKAFDQTLREFPGFAEELSGREQLRTERLQGLRALRAR